MRTGNSIDQNITGASDAARMANGGSRHGSAAWSTLITSNRLAFILSLQPNNRISSAFALDAISRSQMHSAGQTGNHGADAGLGVGLSPCSGSGLGYPMGIGEEKVR